eukprot:GHVH01005640.1.p1 GENE.GHVH01005640.1~~GHVH01005640.1.p1  ORF type:complete len:195 (-),score=19.02 GHVH01005640.1:57-641(-)
MSTENKPVVVFVLGGPGAGKGTFSKLIQEKYGYHHISAGDCLREEMANPNSHEGASISKHIKEGTIVPVEVTCNLLKKKMKNLGWSCEKFLIDGFPRNQNNLDGWNKIMGDEVEIRFCLSVTCPEEVMEKRLLQRGQTSGRTDDNIESIRKRFRTFNDETADIISHFADKGLCKTLVNESTIEEAWETCASYPW